MFDLQVLALQGDVTRVITFQLARETSNRTYPEIGVPEAHHPLTHNGGNPEMLAKVAQINAFHVSLFAYFLEKLKATPDGDGTLLDHSHVPVRQRHEQRATSTITSTCRSWWPAAARASSRAGATSATTSPRRWRTCT